MPRNFVKKKVELTSIMQQTTYMFSPRIFLCYQIWVYADTEFEIKDRLLVLKPETLALPLSPKALANVAISEL